MIEGPNGWPNRLAACAVAAAVFVLLLVTAPRLAIVWDEGYTLGREARVRLWFEAIARPASLRGALAAAAQGAGPARSVAGTSCRRLPPIRSAPVPVCSARRCWPGSGRSAARSRTGTRRFYAIVGLLGDVIAPGLPPLERARLGPMLVFSLTAGAVFGFVGRRFGTWPAALAAGAWVLQPRLFAHAHYATYDALLTSLWVSAILAFVAAIEPTGDRRGPRWGWVVLFGLLCGWAADTKLTGWFLPLPFLVWTALYRDRRAFWTLLCGGLIAGVTLYVFNPPWWPDPIGGVERFLHRT